MSLIAALGAFEMGLIYALVALGVLLTFRILNFPDLTVDGTFPLGGAVAAALISAGMDPVVATLAACLAGASAGYVTAYLHVRLHIMQLLASILVMIALYSINLRIMGKPNVPLLDVPTVFDLVQPLGWADEWLKPACMLVVVAVVKLLLDALFATDLGMALRATGSNPRMARAQGVSTDAMTLGGLALSNALVAFGGALYAQSQGGADISMGIGTIVIGLAAVIIGETLMPARRLAWVTLACVMGAVMYRVFIAAALNGDFVGLQAQDLNLVTAVLVTLALLIPGQRARWQRRRARAEQLAAQDSTQVGA